MLLVLDYKVFKSCSQMKCDSFSILEAIKGCALWCELLIMTDCELGILDTLS